MTTPIAPPGRKRLVHHLDTPFSTVSWPEISSDDQDTILELLCNLLSPIGQHRRTHIKPSRGKRAAKLEAKVSKQDVLPSVTNIPRPPKPVLCNHVDIGFNAITRGFESMSGSKSTGKPEPDSSRRPYSMVFVTRGNQSATFNCHFPKMVAASSHKLDPQHNIKLIGFSKPCSDRLSSCLGIARVSALAITRDAPGADALWAFVKEHVPTIHAEWLNGKNDPHYRPTQISSVETVVGAKKLKITQAARLLRSEKEEHE